MGKPAQNLGSVEGGKVTAAETAVCERGAEAARALGVFLRPAAAEVLRRLLGDRKAAVAALMELVSGRGQLTAPLRTGERWVVRQVLYAALGRDAVPMGASAVEVLLRAVTDPEWAASVLDACGGTALIFDGGTKPRNGGKI
jgi:HEAT repeat protein